MRSVQRGISAVFIAIAILGIAVAITVTYFISFQNQQQKLKAINSFEDCAKLYPVMESYPEQCNTPDGKHFTRDLLDEEKESKLNKETDEVTVLSRYVECGGIAEFKYAGGRRPSLEEVNLLAQDDLASFLGINCQDIEIIKKEKVTWSDTCIGLPAHSRCGVKIEVPGYLLEFSALSRTYRYHTGGEFYSRAWSE